MAAYSRPPTAYSASRDTSVDTGPVGPTLCPTLIGRDDEMASLLAALEAAGRSEGSVVVLTGEPGMGKSRLVNETRVQARAMGFAVVAGRGTEGDNPAPFRPLTHALLAEFRTTGAPDSPELRPLRGALGRVVPEWRDHVAAQPEEPMVVVAEAVLRLLRVLAANGACLVVLEDLQWSDPETLAVVEYLADNLASEPVVCLVTVRSDEATPALSLARSLSARRVAAVVELRRLAEADIGRMAQACLGVDGLPPELAGPLTAWADGVPFLVEELLAAWTSAGVLVHATAGWSVEAVVEPVVPPTFADTIRRRLAGLGPHGQAVLRAAAVLGRRFDWALLPAIAQLDEAVVLAALRDAVDAQLLTDEAVADWGRFRFRHALTRDAVLGELLSPERAALSIAALEALERLHPTLEGDWCQLAAELAQSAGNIHKGARLLALFGRRALAQGALATAEAALEQARSLSVDDAALRAGVEETLVEVLSLAGKVDRAMTVGEELLSTMAALDRSSSRRAEVHLLLARALAASGAWDVAGEQVERARDLGAEAGEPSLTPRIDALAAHLALGQSRLDDAVTLARRALDAAQTLGLPEVACEALEAIGRRARLRDLGEAETAFEQARVIADDHGLTLWRIRALHELASIDMLGRFGLKRLSTARELAYDAGALATAATLDLQISSVLAFHQEAVQGLAVAERCAEAARRFRLGLLLPMALVRQAQCHAVARDRTRMEAAIREALDEAGGDADVSAGVWGQCRATLSLLREDRDQALRELDTGMGFLEDRPGALPWTFRGMWALLHSLDGPDGERARAQLRASDVMAVPLHRAMLAYAEAVALGREGDRRGAEAAFALAEAEIDTLEGRGGLGHLALRLVGEAALVDAWGNPVCWVQQVIAYFEGTGHDRVVLACRGLLRSAGIDTPRRLSSGSQVPPGLRALGVTARELDVLVLVGERLSNKEIAIRLYLSHRTIDKHVQHLLAKTGLADRGQLAAMASAMGLAGTG